MLGQSEHSFQGIKQYCAEFMCKDLLIWILHSPNDFQTSLSTAYENIVEGLFSVPACGYKKANCSKISHFISCTNKYNQCHVHLSKYFIINM